MNATKEAKGQGPSVSTCPLTTTNGWTLSRRLGLSKSSYVRMVLFERMEGDDGNPQPKR